MTEGGWTFSFKFPKGVVPGPEKPVEQAPVKEPVVEPPGPTPEAKPGKAATPEPGTDAMQRLVEVAQEEVDAILARTSPGEGRDKAFADKRQAGKDLLEYLEAGDQLLFDDGTSLTITGIRRNKKTGEIELIDWLGDQKNAKGERKAWVLSSRCCRGLANESWVRQGNYLQGDRECWWEGQARAYSG